jgi:signal transduction histidine kinase
MDIRVEGLVAGGEATVSWVVALLILLGVGLALLCRRAMRQRRARSAGQAAAVREQMEHALAERLRNERSRLLSAVAHDLRQPLYAMSLTTQSLEQQRVARSPAVLLSQMRHALASADALLDTLDTVARLETGALRPRVSVFSMQAMLDRIDRQYGPQAQARGLHWTVTPSLECVRTDAALLERMLDSLVANAVHCTERGGVLVSCRRRGPQLLLQVWDTGPGLDPVGLATSGAPHYRDDGVAAADGGVGFGLAVVKHAARLLGIRLNVRSRVGHGTCFSLLLPPYPKPRGHRVARQGARRPQFSA